MADGLKNSVARGVTWSMAERVGSALLQLAVSLLLLRLLVDTDFGVMAILTAFSAVALIIVDSGFSQMLIRKADPRPEDYKSVFIFNLAASLLLYVLLVATSPLIARFYDDPVLMQLAPFYFLQLPVNALCVIQTTIFVRELRFGLLSKVTFAATLVSGFVAISMALAGCGVWSIAAQHLTLMAVRASLLWWFSKWRPNGAFDRKALREMAPYSFSLLGTELISTFYNKIPQFFLGKVYSVGALGYFDQARKFKDQCVTSVVQAVQNVTYPALSKIADEEQKFAESYRQVILIVCFVMFPAMLGLIAVAEDMLAVLVDERWMPIVPYLRIFCLTGLFYPVAQIAYNILKVKSDGRIIVRLEIVKKIVMTVVFAVTIPTSIRAVAWGLAGISFFEMAVNFYATRRYTTLTAWRVVQTLLPVAAIAAVMFGLVLLVGGLVDMPLLRLLVMLGVGVGSYLLLSALFRLEAFREVAGILKKQIARK